MRLRCSNSLFDKTYRHHLKSQTSNQHNTISYYIYQLKFYLKILLRNNLFHNISQYSSVSHRDSLRSKAYEVHVIKPKETVEVFDIWCLTITTSQGMISLESCVSYHIILWLTYNLEANKNLHGKHERNIASHWFLNI